MRYGGTPNNSYVLRLNTATPLSNGVANAAKYEPMHGKQTIRIETFKNLPRAERRLLAFTYNSQAYFSIRDSFFGDANKPKGLSAVTRRQSNHLQILLKGIFHVYELQKGGAERRTPWHSRTRAIGVYLWLLEAFIIDVRSRLFLYTLDGDPIIFWTFPRLRPGLSRRAWNTYGVLERPRTP